MHGQIRLQGSRRRYLRRNRKLRKGESVLPSTSPRVHRQQQQQRCPKSGYERRNRHSGRDIRDPQVLPGMAGKPRNGTETTIVVMVTAVPIERESETEAEVQIDGGDNLVSCPFFATTTVYKDYLQC